MQLPAPKDRIIDDFVKPYEMCCTPYYKLDFSEITKKMCYDGNSKYKISTDMKVCKIIIVGDVSVGKTSIVNRFCRKMFDSSYKSTIGVDFEMERFYILGIPYNLQIWDTAGQERFKSIAQSYYRNSHVVIVVFDLSKPETLTNTRRWFLDAMQTCGDMLPYVFLVGTKKDLLGGFAYKNSELNAVNMAKALNAEYWPVSSKNGENIDKLFARVAVLTFDDGIKNELSNQKKIVVASDILSFKNNKNPSKQHSTCTNCKSN